MVNYVKKLKLQHHSWVIIKYCETRNYTLPIVSQLLNPNIFQVKKKNHHNPRHSCHFDKGLFYPKACALREFLIFFYN